MRYPPFVCCIFRMIVLYVHAFGIRSCVWSTALPLLILRKQWVPTETLARTHARTHTNPTSHLARLSASHSIRSNKVQILQLDEQKGQFKESAVFDHPYPTTKIMWMPDKVLEM